jgi:hypothetical protein
MDRFLTIVKIVSELRIISFSSRSFYTSTMLLSFGKQVYGCTERLILNLRYVCSEADAMADSVVARMVLGVQANTVASRSCIILGVIYFKYPFLLLPFFVK